MTFVWSNEYWYYVVGVIVAIGLFFYLFVERDQHVELEEPKIDVATLARTRVVVDPETGMTYSPVFPKLPQTDLPRNNLLQIKGLGPNMAMLLEAVGVKRFDQIAALTPGEIEAIDIYLGKYTGRIIEDRWTDQAALLAAGDIDAYEAEFGKLERHDDIRL
jgi:predicted flap endonuclease-1-like 5' DNA nuclease